MGFRYTKAFYELDLTLDAKLDVHDVKWALEALFFSPSEQDVNDLIYHTASMHDLIDIPEDGELDLYDFIHSMENWHAILKLPHLRDELPTAVLSNNHAPEGGDISIPTEVIEPEPSSKKCKKGKKKDSKKRPSPTSTAVTSLKVNAAARTRTVV